MPKSLRKRNSVLQKISSIQKSRIISPDRKRIVTICEDYVTKFNLTSEEYDVFYDKVDEILIANVSEYIEPRMSARTITTTVAEEIVFSQPFEDVRDRLWSLLETWILKYRGPIQTLAEIAENDQNIHETDVLKKTTDSVLLLGKVEIPPGQKTLAEINEAFLSLLPPKLSEVRDMYTECMARQEPLDEVNEYMHTHNVSVHSGQATVIVSTGQTGQWKVTEYAGEWLTEHLRGLIYAAYYKQWYSDNYTLLSNIESTIKDMKDWGNRTSVMKKGENVYKATLRGLWAKIKESPSRTELVKRLYEECYEAVGLCADGHVGRLCNVMVGFDPEFTCSISPMEYFQNSIALISENTHSTQEMKLQHATDLMNSVGMPEGERKAWLDALL